MLFKSPFADVDAHVDFEVAHGTLALPAVIGISDAEITLRGHEANSLRGHEFNPQEAEKQPAKMGEHGDSALRRLEDADDGDDDQNSNHVFGFDREGQRKEKHLLIGVENSKRHHQAKDATGSAQSCSARARAEEVC